MKALIVYDSLYGNTEKIARAIGDGISGEVKVLPVGEANSAELKGIDLLIVGAPTHGGRPKPMTQTFLDKIPTDGLKGKNVAAFDTRFAYKDHGLPLQVLMRAIGFAAPKIANRLKKKGGKLVVKPEGFIVEGKEGPLKHGELERAKTWAKGISESKK